MAELKARRVLLVEDEGAVALLIEDMLEQLGCEVAASVARIADAAEAARSQPFDFAILDVNVAGETSFELARSLFQRETPFLFSTGYGEPGLPVDLRACPVLAKPFTLDGLRQKISEAMGHGK